MPAGAAAGERRRSTAEEPAGVERDMIGFCLSRRGKIATADVMACDGCDWSDAPGGTGACYLLCDLPSGAIATLRACCGSD